MENEQVVGTEPELEEEQQAEETPEEKLKEPEKEKSEKKYSDEEVNAILSKKFAKWTAQKEKELDEAQKLAEMDAQQKAEYERDKLEKELAELKRENTLNAMGKTARTMLSEQGVHLSDALVSILVTEEAESTKTNVDNFVQLFKEAVDAAVNEKLKSGTPKRMAGGKAMTRDEILNIADAAARRKAIQENLELFN